tara:strand:+ start:596 stop:1042 length:447 start_codon:yes stop_codon:yes gene_type:complete
MKQKIIKDPTFTYYKKGGNVEKAMEGRSDGSTAKELKKLAEKDPMTHIDLELMNNIERNYKEAVEQGFKGDMEDYINSLSLEGLKKVAMADGGPVDFTSMSPGQMKAIFISENGYEPRSAKELVRGVKMYLKNLDIDGIPFGTFGKKD